MDLIQITNLSEMIEDRGHPALLTSHVELLQNANDNVFIPLDTFNVYLEIQNSKSSQSVFSQKNKLNIDDIIILSGTSNFVNLSIKKITNKNGWKRQCFTPDYFSFNITKHIMVPKHAKISEIEKSKLFEKLSIQRPEQLPIIFTTDPVSKYYGFQPGDVCKVSRTNYTSYRVVVMQHNI